MCVAAVAWQAHPDWHLVAIGNRDEYHGRPAAALDQWQDGRGIIAGKDLRSGGTWLGVSPEGRFALVTNLRGHGDPDPERASRGALVIDQLTGTGSYSDAATASLKDFNPFNLIVANGRQARFLCNRPEPVRALLSHGIYGLSNGTLDEPWAKTLQLKGALLDWLNRDGAPLEELFAPLADETLPDIGLHPDEPSDVAREAPDTPVFIRDSVYGTRCSTVVAVDRHGKGMIAERSFAADGSVTGNVRFVFAWPDLRA